MLDREAVVRLENLERLLHNNFLDLQAAARVTNEVRLEIAAEIMRDKQERIAAAHRQDRGRWWRIRR